MKLSKAFPFDYKNIFATRFFLLVTHKGILQRCRKNGFKSFCQFPAEGYRPVRTKNSGEILKGGPQLVRRLMKNHGAAFIF